MNGRSKPVVGAFAAVVFMLLAGAAAALALASDKSRPADALWWVVGGLCVTDQRVLRVPSPCLKVDLTQGWALVQDPQARTHILLVPTHRLGGIESPQLLQPDEPNYWDDAWNARPYLDRLAGRSAPRQDLALVINAVSGRTQNQLHIHLSCLKPDVAPLLRDHMDQIGLTWKPLSFRLLGYRVLARRLNGADFGAQDPFKILADGVRGAHDTMGTRSLAAVGAVFPDGSPGFVLLSHTASPATGDIGVGEDILDYSCRILGSPTHLAD